MKRLFAILLTILMLGCLTACGDNSSSSDDEKIDAGDVVEKELDKAEEMNSFSEEAVEYYFEKAGNVKLDDVAPDWEYTIGKMQAYADDPDSGYGHGVITFTKTDGEVSEDEYNAWLKKVFDATAKASQDGYNIIGYEFVADGEDALSKTTLEDALSGFMKGWGYRYNDKIMTVYVDQKYDNDKDSETGALFYYYGVNVDIGVGLQKSFSDTMDEAEQYMEENEDEIKEAVDDYLG